MSGEYETDRNVVRRNDLIQTTMKIDSSNDDDDTLEELAGSANNSIIGKVKSRVSSIIPSSFSKWFSPSMRNNDSLNGSFSVGTARRRRRLEIEDDEYASDDCDPYADRAVVRSDYKDHLGSHSDNVNKDSDQDDSDKNSEDELPNEPAASKQMSQRTIKSSGYINQPPSKRSRISFDVTSVNHQPLIASTPSIDVSRRNIYTSPLSEDTISKPSTSHTLNYFTEANAYNQKNIEQSYDFVPSSAMDAKTQENYTNRSNTNDKTLEKKSAISSRRTLHLPSTSQTASDRIISMDFSKIKRQSLSGIRDINKRYAESTDTNTSANIIEEEKHLRDKLEGRVDRDDQIKADVKTRGNLNGDSLILSGNKKQKLNGADEADITNVDVDSASESSEGCLGTISEIPNILTMGQRKTGLFNMSNLNGQNGKKSRTPSFGNGINFYSHLEGRKSLFSGTANAGDSANALNNSTLSLTSLNRRQFNASIYGSTAALSDSRLLNTFSPFYKGKTTYGGAAAYKKYSVGSGASRISSLTPTIIRPTSSLSTLSSSNNSIIANTGGSNAIVGLGSNIIENNSAISSTAKRILDLINDFATPLSEAKKMANTNVKPNPQFLMQAKSRLNDSDLQASRAIRLSQVRTPYSRPAVTLQPTFRNNSTLLPPVRELQVPSMSQLLQMKKMQSTTERSRQITMQNSGSITRSIVDCGEYTLPMVNENHVAGKNDSEVRQQQQHQQPHTNKIKSKVRTSARITASKNATIAEDDESSIAVNLPNIAFPLMQSVPKFDITLPMPKNVALDGTSKRDISTLDNMAKSKSTVEPNSLIGSGGSTITLSNKTSFNFNEDTNKKANTTDTNPNGKENKAVATEIKLNFKFSVPITFACVNDTASSQQNSIAVSKNYKFSPPSVVCSEISKIVPLSSTQRNVQSEDIVLPQLKSGSVLDALKDPVALPPNSKENVKKAGGIEVNVGFGNQFKKATTNKWECETCLIRNESNLDKCVACETPQSKSTSIPPTIMRSAITTPLASGSSGFGNQFKKSSTEWDCDVCMVRNKQQADKCASCETPRKGATTSTKLAGSNWQSNSFGNAFKAKGNTWECPTCLINNKSDCDDCVACQTKNPYRVSGDGSVCSTTTKKSTKYNFGFSTADSTTLAVSNAPPDAAFKSLATAQMSAKWECEACMTRNDAARNKCVCCEQAKPGTTTPDAPSNGPKFMFGSTASSQFTFGFATTTNGTPTKDSGVVVVAPTVIGAFNQKTEKENSKDFVFGTSTTIVPPISRGSGFSFGIKSISAPNEKEITTKGKGKDEESRDVADNGNLPSKEISEVNPSAFKFGSTTTPASNELDTTNKINFKFGVPPKANTATDPTVKFSLVSPVTNVNDSSSKSELTPVTLSDKISAAGSFSFGNAVAPQKAQTTSGFSFGIPTESTNSVTKSTTKPTFSFGASPTTQLSQATTISTTTSTATVKPMFSFGSNNTATTAPISTSASASSTTSSTTVSTFTSSAGGFSFGSSITGSVADSPSSKPMFGNYTTPINVSVAPSSVASVPGTTISTLPTAPANIFGTFGASTSSAKTTTTSATPTLSSTANMPATNANPFGTISQGGTLSVSGESKPTASATMIFGSANKSAITTQVTTASFVFGSSTSNVTTPGAGSNTTTSGNMVTSATSWPKSGFTFGAPTGNAGISITNEAPKPVFGSFVVPLAPAISVGANVTASGGSATFGSVAANASTVSPATMFGAGSSASTSTAQSTQNLFGNVSTVPTSFGAPPSFGNSSANTAATNSGTFGNFGAAATNTSGDGASAPKKSEPAFNFGGISAQITSSGGFNFGTQANTTTAKPAFNFSASSAPTFNFSGSNSHATPNAPFQFNAGTAPASSNIFAPTPSAPNAPGAMQARRKIRQPTRRLTPR